MPDKKTYRLSVAVFKATPNDHYWKRHVGLFFEDEASDEKLFAHIIGSPGAWAFNKRDMYNPENSTRCTQTLEVGILRKLLTKDEVWFHMEEVPIKEDDVEFGCQNWVEAGLLLLKDRDLITEEEYNSGLDNMVTGLLEAQDDEF